MPWKQLAQTPEGLKAIKAHQAQLVEALRTQIPKEIEALVKEPVDAIDVTLDQVNQATIPDEFEQALKDHEKFLSEEEVAKRGRVREEQMRKEKTEEAYKEILATIQTEIIARVKTQIAAKSDKFQLKYETTELEAIINKGKELGLSNRVIEDMIFTGSRTAKAISAAELMQQMENWVKVISKRGYPYRFANRIEFQKFNQYLVDSLKKASFPADDVRVQGSSLRNPGANDVDVAVFVDEFTFDNQLIIRFNGKIIKLSDPNTKISLQGKSHTQLLELSNDIATHPTHYNAPARTFQNAMENGIISSKSDISKPLKTIAKSIKEKYPNLNIEAISILLKGGSFELSPDLPGTGTH